MFKLTIFPSTNTRDLIRLQRKIFSRPRRLFLFGLAVLSLLLYQPSATNQPLQIQPIHAIQTSSSLPYPLTLPMARPTKESQETLPKVTAEAFLVADLKSNIILAEKDAHAQKPLASITKIVTALVALKNYSLDQPILVSEAVVEQSQGSLMGLKPNETISVNNLIWGLLLNSGNDAAHTLASAYPAQEIGFIEVMNKTASLLSLQQTHFANVTGLDDSNHHSSAYDIWLISKYALKDATFRAIVSSPRKVVTGQVQSADKTYTQWHVLKNTNALLEDPDVKGIKTGWTESAGESLVLLTKVEGQEVVIVLLNSQDRFNDGRYLIQWTKDNFFWRSQG